MATTGIKIGDYIDPRMVASTYGNEIVINPSWGVGIMSLRDVPMVDGRTAVVDSEGIIVDFK